MSRLFGVAIDISHTAPSPVGATVEIRVRLADAEGRLLTFAIEARDDVGEISRGTHQRAVTDRARFDARLAARTA